MTQPRDEQGRFAPADKAESWGDAIGEAWDAAESEGDDAAEDQPEPAEAQEPEGEPAGENEPEEAGEETESSGAAPVDGGPSPPSAVEPPEHWSADDKARFAALPAEAKEWFIGVRKQIERGAQERFDQAAEARRLAGELDEVLAPVRHEMAPGVTPAQLMRQYVQLHQMANTDLGGTLSRLAMGYGAALAGSGQARQIVQQVAQALNVDLGGFHGQADQAEEWLDPRAQAATQTLQSKLDALEAEIRRRDQAQQQEALNRTQAQINQFREAKAADGSPAHPHFDQLSRHMGALMQAGAATTLEDAYAQALWASPELRAEQLKRQEAEAARAREAARRASVQKAKGATTPRVSKEAVTEAPPKRSLKEELEAQFEAHAA